MSGNLIKNIILATLLVWISFMIGTEAAADIQSASLVICCIVALFVFIILGHNCWWLLFILSPVMGLLPLGAIQQLPIQYSIAFLILIYWIIMRLIGRAQFIWRSLLWLDYSLLFILLYIALTYYWNPVSVSAFADHDTQIIGGKGYIQILSAFIYYLIISSIPYDWEQIKKVLKWMARLTVAASLVGCIIIFIQGGDPHTGMTIQEAAKHSRFSAFLPVGRVLFTFIVSLYPLYHIIFSPVRLTLVIASVIAVMLSGFRNIVASLAFFSLWTSIIYKNLLLFICLSLCTYGALIYCSSEKILEDLPFGVQRTLSAIPGIKVSKEAKVDAEGSVEWRKVMWKWALDPRTGYIKDYVFGGGMGLDKYQMQRWSTLLARGQIDSGNLEMFADKGLWHNFYIETISTIGTVGLILVIFFMLETLWLLMMIEISLRHDASIFYVVFAFAYFVQDTVHHLISTGSSGGVLMNTIGAGALAKVICVEAKKTGFIIRFCKRKHYIPMAVKSLLKQEKY